MFHTEAKIAAKTVAAGVVARAFVFGSSQNSQSSSQQSDDKPGCLGDAGSVI
ncbi:hypothetical protein SAMN05428964_105167 [Thalassospira xiamenensis]|uniref:Uncharacterized protein n=1 Tax=Thalassospira xiamenensis TaxID=220697 RepID=A0A285TWZ7_9PROT|nr:hypothetical protein SAMN05428964_105167 [Thalassospira xiamenensis]